MGVRDAADNRCGEGLEQRKERAEGAAEKDNIVARVDGFREGVFIRV